MEDLTLEQYKKRVEELGQALQTTTQIKLNAFTKEIQADRLTAENGAVKSANGNH